jgi:hypothetical protein
MSSILRNRVRIQYASNFFGQWSPQVLSKNVAPYLALLGNCVNKEDPQFHITMKALSKGWERVFLIPGPYELTSKKKTPYHTKLDSLRDTLYSKYPNICLMDQSEATLLHGVQLLGFYGWANSPKSADICFQQPSLESDIYAYRSTGLQPISPELRKQFHTEDFTWMQQQLANIRMPTIVLSHTLPSPFLLQRSLDDFAYQRIYLDIFPTQSLKRFPSPLVKGWLGGATGSCSSGLFHSTFMGVNSWKSSPNQTKPNPQYQPNQFFEIALPNWKEQFESLLLPLPLPYKPFRPSQIPAV